MSRAFIREDVDPPERSGRKRSESGLPPGAINYMTLSGATRLQAELKKLRSAGENPERVAELERILRSVQIVDPPHPQSRAVSFGATVTVSDTAGKTETYRIVGVDELQFDRNAVSWISPLGRALLAAELGERLTLGDGRIVRIVKLE